MHNVNKDLIERIKINAKQSLANKRKVGAVLIDEDKTNPENFTIYSDGYNRINEKLLPHLIENSENITFDYVLHAEEDAIMKYVQILKRNNVGIRNLVMYNTYSPCYKCAKMIVELGIRKLIYLEEHKCNFTTPSVKDGYSPKEYLEKCGVEVIHYQEDKIDEIKIKETKEVAIIYHSKDVDGFMSAYLLKNYYNFSDFDNCIYNITMFPYCYETESEWMCGNFDIYLFGDITPTIEWLKNNVNTFNINGDKILRIYDHHATKFNEIFNFVKEFNNLFDSKQELVIDYHFYPDKSGAKIIYDDLQLNYKYYKFNEFVNLISLYYTWQFDKPDFDPELKERVITFDLQLKQLNKSNTYWEFASLMNQLSEEDDIRIEQFIKDSIKRGKQFLTEMQIEIKNIINSGIYNQTGLFIYFGRPEYFITEKIYQQYPEVKFIIAMNNKLNEDKISFSVRSKKYNCVDFVRRYSKDGGGHFGASGFNVPMEEGYRIIESLKILTLNN